MLTQSEVATALGLSRARICQLVSQGLPLTSAASALAWREKQARYGGRRSQKGAGTKMPQRPPETHLPPIAKILDDDAKGAYERHLALELQAYLKAVAAINDASPAAARLIAVHTAAAGALPQLRALIEELQAREAELVDGEWLRQIVAEHDDRIRKLAESMPTALAARLCPNDPEHAEKELKLWVRETLLRTLHRTNPLQK